MLLHVNVFPNPPVEPAIIKYEPALKPDCNITELRNTPL